jgi:hypothetical protein
MRAKLKSAAITTTKAENYKVIPRHPIRLSQNKIQPQAQILAANEADTTDWEAIVQPTKDQPIQGYSREEISEEQATSIFQSNQADRLKIYYFGFVRYDTIVDGVDELGFLFLYSPESRRFLMQTNPEYHYLRKNINPPQAKK